MPSHRDRVRFGEKSLSYHGSGSAMAGAPGQLRRPKTFSDLPSASTIGVVGQVSPLAEVRPKLTKVLLNVTIQGSVGATHVLMKPESTVADLIAAAVSQYVKEGRRPVLPTWDPSSFDLHYSQFSLESLDRGEKLLELGSRNFFLCKRKADEVATNASTSCSKEAGKLAATTRFNGLPWLRFMGFSQ
ncbi:hypothetical protein V2J09_006401 [Rumex salicifolius]